MTGNENVKDLSEVRDGTGGQFEFIGTKCSAARWRPGSSLSNPAAGGEKQLLGLQIATGDGVSDQVHGGPTVSGDGTGGQFEFIGTKCSAVRWRPGSSLPNPAAGGEKQLLGLQIATGDGESDQVHGGPTVVPMGSDEALADRCRRSRIVASPGTLDPAGEQGGGNARRRRRPGRSFGPFFFFLIVSMILGVASGEFLEADLSEDFLFKTAGAENIPMKCWSTSCEANVYPYNLYRLNSEIPIEFPIFPENPFNFRDNLTTGAKYRNLFDMTVEAGIRAMAVAGDEHSDNGVYIEMYLKGLLGHLKSGLVTPLRKDGESETNIYELFDRDTKQGSDSRRNWGMFYPNMTQKYTINFSGSARIGGSGRGLLKMVVGGLVLAISAVLLLQ